VADDMLKDNDLEQKVKLECEPGKISLSSFSTNNP
jgi:hypothetical protein